MDYENTPFEQSVENAIDRENARYLALEADGSLEKYETRRLAADAAITWICKICEQKFEHCEHADMCEDCSRQLA